MSTNEQREFAGVSPINEPALPTESKHDSDEAHRKAHEMAIYQKELRKLDNYQIVEYQHDLAETLEPREIIKNQLKNGDFKDISEEALRTPYRKAA